MVVILVHFFTKHTFVEGHSSMLSQGVKCVVNIVSPLVVNMTASGGPWWREMEKVLDHDKDIPAIHCSANFPLKGTTIHVHLCVGLGTCHPFHQVTKRARQVQVHMWQMIFNTIS